MTGKVFFQSFQDDVLGKFTLKQYEISEFTHANVTTQLLLEFLEELISAVNMSGFLLLLDETTQALDPKTQAS